MIWSNVRAQDVRGALFIVHEAVVPLAYYTHSNSNSDGYKPLKTKLNRDYINISLSPKGKEKQIHPCIIS